jgi:transposase
MPYNQMISMGEIKKLFRDKKFYTKSPTQRRYEMIRAWRISGMTQKEAAKTFNYSVENLRKIWKKYQDDGIAGIKDKPKGPQRRRDLTKMAEPMIIELRENDNLSIHEIEEKLKEENISVSYGTIYRVLKDHNLPKKTRRRGR